MRASLRFRQHFQGYPQQRELHIDKTDMILGRTMSVTTGGNTNRHACDAEEKTKFEA
jgi:hypothetical protein